MGWKLKPRKMGIARYLLNLNFILLHLFACFQYDGFTNVVINVERVRILDPSEQNVLAIGKRSGDKYPIIYIPKPDNG